MSYSVFEYEVNNKKGIFDISNLIEKEINNNFHFILTKTKEIKKEAGKKVKIFARTKIAGDIIQLFVKDAYFNSDYILDQILTSLCFNFIDFGEIRLENLKLSNFISKKLLGSNIKKNNFGSGPYLGTILKPSYNLSLNKKISIVKKLATNGFNFIKEDETYFAKKETLLRESSILQQEINKISDRCFYIPNITPYLNDYEFIDKLIKSGTKIVMVNYLLAGLSNVKKATEKFRNIYFWGHRIGHKAIENYVSDKALLPLGIYSGLNMIHIGTPLLNDKQSVRYTYEKLNIIKTLNPFVLPVFTKISLEIAKDILCLFGKNIILMLWDGVENSKIIYREIKTYAKE